MRLKRFGAVAATVLLPGAFLVACVSEGQFDFATARVWTFFGIMIWIASRISQGTGRRIGNRLALAVVSSWALGAFIQPNRLWHESEPMLHPMVIPFASFIGLALLLLMYWAETGAMKRFDERVGRIGVPIPRWLARIGEGIVATIAWIIVTPIILAFAAMALFPWAVLINGVLAHLLGVPFVMDAGFYTSFAAGLLVLFIGHLMGQTPARKRPRWNGYRWTNS